MKKIISVKVLFLLIVLFSSFAFAQSRSAELASQKDVRLQKYASSDNTIKEKGVIQHIVIEPSKQEKSGNKASNEAEQFVFVSDSGERHLLEKGRYTLAEYRNSLIEFEGVRLPNGKLLPHSLKKQPPPIVFNQLTGGVTQTSGTRSVLVMQINFSNDGSEPETAEQVRNKMFYDDDNVRKFFQMNSDYRFDIAGILRQDIDVTPWLTIASDNTNCEENLLTTWLNESNSLALKEGFDTSQYQTIIYRYPFIANCTIGPAASLGTLGDTINHQIVVYQSTEVRKRTIAHEIGHNLGLLHASVYRNCTSTNIPADCQFAGQFDKASTMGGHYVFFNNYQRLQLGWLNGRHRIVTQSGTYRLMPPTQYSKIPHVLEIKLKDKIGNFTGTSIWLEVRKNVFFDSFTTTTSDFARGLAIRYGTENLSLGEDSFLVQPELNSSSGNDAVLMSGETFIDSNSGVSLTLIQERTAFLGAKVMVTLTR